MRDLDVSIVIYRDYDTPLKAIESLEAHTSHAVEKKIFVVDNSGDITSELLNLRNNFLKTISRYVDVEYIDAHENLGFGKANNVALKKSNARYFAYVNPDIVFVEDAFSSLIAYMDENASVGMVIPRIVDAEGVLQEVYRRDLTVLDAFNRTVLKNKMAKRHAFHTMKDMDYEKPFRVPFGQGSFLVGRTELLQKIGGFDDRYFMYCEDADLCRQVNKVSKLEYVPDAVVEHKWERGSSKDLKLFRIHLKSYFLYFRKWGLQIK